MSGYSTINSRVPNKSITFKVKQTGVAHFSYFQLTLYLPLDEKKMKNKIHAQHNNKDKLKNCVRLKSQVWCEKKQAQNDAIKIP